MDYGARSRHAGSATPFADNWAAIQVLAAEVAAAADDAAADAVHDDEVIMDMNVFFTVHEFYDREPGPESVWRKL